MSATWPSLAVPRARDRIYVTGSIRGWSRLHLTALPGGLKSASSLRSLFQLTVKYSVTYKYNLSKTKTALMDDTIRSFSTIVSAGILCVRMLNVL